MIAGERCRVELGPPYSVLVLTLEEWFRAPAEFRAGVLSDAVVLYAAGLRLRELVAGDPWLLLRYTAPTSSSRACASRAVAGLERRGLAERVAPGVALAPWRAGARLLDALERCGASISSSRLVVYQQATMWCGRCPYCGMEVVEADYEEAKRRLREHLLAAHMDRVRERAEELRREGKGLPGGSLRGLAGFIASLAIKEC